MALPSINAQSAIYNYIGRIRNDGKRRYAQAWWDYLSGHKAAPGYEHFGIASMTAQAVRLQIAALWPLA